jgi:acetate kinase
MSAAFLVLNTGSSSVKFALYDCSDLSLRLRGVIDESPTQVTCRLDGPDAAALGTDSPPAGGHEAHIEWVLARVQANLRHLKVVAAGHRIVHGGIDFTKPVRLTPEVMAQLRSLCPLAPAHQPYNLGGVDVVEHIWPHVAHYGCFDTAFHHTQDRLARLMPLPRHLIDEGMMRYGFHGLSYQHSADVLPSLIGARAHGRVIMAHLGNGASLCAMLDGRSKATTMGMTAYDGLMMGTRSGAIDPGAVLYLMQHYGKSADEVAAILGKQSGLLGVSGLSSDMRVLEASDDAHAIEARALFTYRIVRETGSLIAALGGIDAFVFTGGIGEHSVLQRAAICQGLAWAGLRLDDAANQHHGPLIHAASSEVSIAVIEANEEMPIARAMKELHAYE